MKILVADDDAELREMLEILLDSAGYAISAHPNGKKAWESLQKDGADLAVLDINMPEMDGLELLDLIRGSERFADMPVLLLTANTSKAAQASGMERGADDYMTKPFDTGVLLQRVKLLEKAYPAGG